MEKLVGFATRIVLENYSVRTEGKRNEKKTVRHRPLVINYSAFQKTEEERIKLKKMKKAFKKDPMNGRDEFLQEFINSKIPNWNLTFTLTK